VNKSFGYSLINSYNTTFKSGGALTGADRNHISRVYLTRLASSKYVLCPPGLGMDSYRVYETLLLGAIPVVEISDGLDRSLSYLPVLFMKNLTELSPRILEHVNNFIKATTSVSSHGNSNSELKWNYRKLTTHYWTSMITSVAKSGGQVVGKYVEIVGSGDLDNNDNCRCWFPYGHCLRELDECQGNNT
jgi:hypothetical protein